MASVKTTTVEWDNDLGVFFVKVVYSNKAYTHIYEDDNGVFFYKEQAIAEVYAEELLTREYDDRIQFYDASPYFN